MLSYIEHFQNCCKLFTKDTSFSKDALQPCEFTAIHAPKL